MDKRTKQGLTLDQEVERLFKASMAYIKEDSKYKDLDSILKASRDDKLNYIARMAENRWYGDKHVRRVILGGLYEDVEKRINE